MSLILTKEALVIREGEDQHSANTFKVCSMRGGGISIERDFNRIEIELIEVDTLCAAITRVANEQRYMLAKQGDKQ